MLEFDVLPFLEGDLKLLHDNCSVDRRGPNARWDLQEQGDKSSIELSSAPLIKLSRRT
jgi:hypothetical protein